ncbi:MAG TPA: BON domain-containing protein [Thermoanaerobaculia bacterium]|nr:BON domain-containing protein [Thermoanaerobaculia bacterium]
MNTGRNCNGKRKTTSVALAAALASVVAVLGGAGCGTAQPLNARAEQGDTAKIAKIQEALEANFARDRRLSTVTSVKVNPTNGVVTLSGLVPTDVEREAAGKLASSVKGVAMIYNEIQVENSGP